MNLFEIKKSDLAGRIGILHTNHGKVETPAYVPVIHPVRQSIPAKKLREMGFDLVITNAYITLKQHGDEAVRRGIHDIINYDGAIMTDSGGYQVLEYGEVDTDYRRMAGFEKGIKTDFAIPLDRPTGFGLPKKKASDYVDHTLRVSKETLESRDDNGQIWIGPIQGSEYSDLVKKSTRALVGYGFQMLALGSPVEFMESYEYRLLAKMIITAKREMPDSVPLHLFGAGHPLTIPLAIALGCDTFDSASYMLYAKDGRYMHANGTARLQDIAYLPCCCPVCSSTTAKDLKDMEPERRIVQVAKHNLYVLKAEVDSAKQAIMDGRLWEHVMQKARAHPKLMEAVEFFKDLKMLESGTCVFKDKALFLYHPVDQHRPEARRFRSMLSGFKTAKKKLILYPDTQIHPFYSTKDFASMRAKFADAQICSYNPFLGIIPAEVSDIFPAAHNLIPRTSRNGRDYPTFAESLNGFLSQNHFEEITIVADDFMRQIIDSGAEMKAEGAERIENNSMAKIRVIDYEDGVFL